MNIEPTNDDFGDRIGRSLEGARSELERTIKAVCHKAAAKGSLRSGNTVHEVMQTVSDAIEANIRSALAELHRISQQTDLDQSELFDITRSALQDHVQRVELSVRGGTIKHFAPQQFLDDSFQKINDDLQFHLRQFQLGLSEIHCDIRSTHMKNEIHIGAMSGSTIQQGTSNSNQTNSINNEIDVTSALDALGALDDRLSEAICDDAQLANIRADISALKAQLERPEDSTDVVREIGRSLKKVTEGIAINVGSEALTGAALKLRKALGLS
jgi:hypothetical protein